jgi:DNA-binding CsgD family transcriptional regulator
MSDTTFDSVFVALCDWRGRIVWMSGHDGPAKIGDLAWSHLIDESQQRAREMHSKVAALRELQTVQVQNSQGRHFRCWMWPLDSPEVAVCVLGKEVPADLDTLAPRENDCLEMLAQGIDVQEIAKRLDVSVSTVHTHLKRAREKLGLSSIEALISFAARFCFPRSIPLVQEHKS